jgi:RHS repeat-associated protein
MRFPQSAKAVALKAPMLNGRKRERPDPDTVRSDGTSSRAPGAEQKDANSKGSAPASDVAPLPSISLPKGGGAIRGIGEKFAVNPVTGTASLTVPLPTSPGRSGFGPQLTLSYDSGSGNGPFGFGWSLGLPSITRKTDKGLPRYQDAGESDVFIISGAEDLVPVLDAAGNPVSVPRTVEGVAYTIHLYRPRIEGLFARIERWTNQATGEIRWRSISRDNVTTLYGKDNNSRVFDPADPDPAHPTRIFSWLICQSYDDKGNGIVYEYAGESDESVDKTQANERNRVRTANRYLKRIKYGNRVSRLLQPDLTAAQWLFEVVFDYDEGHYEELDLDSTRPEAEQHRFVRASASPARSWAVRPDPFSSHRAGFEARTYRRCRRLLMFHHFAELGAEPCLVRSTEFGYADLDYAQPITVEFELAYQGSTRFASFIRAVTQSGFVRDDSKAVLEHNGVRYVTYLKKSLPPLEFDYSKAAIQDDIRELDASSLENLPIGLDNAAYQWVDLDGEGVTGILTEQAGAWYYKPNFGDGRFGPLQTVALKPSLATLGSGRQQLLDLAGDGQLDLVAFAGPTTGFYERTQDEDWEPFTPFASLPNIPWDDPNLRFADLDGDGHADVLITENEVFTWYPSLAEDGFGPALQVHQPLDEERGPRLVFADGTQSIHLADMCGDGLTDLVRIRNGEVCYWPNVGYGGFGAKVTMDDAPWFDNPDQFDQRRVRVADIDGSGANDIVYLGRDGVRLYFNQSGNRWSATRRLPQFPPVDDLSSVITTDLLGNGTACLVWSSPLPGDTRRPMRYIDLMGGQKPHLLIKSANNLGAESHVRYAASTKFYLADKLAGRPWITRIPFPVQVVERVETYDRVGGNRFVTRYTYHHGYFDGVEREFRGFGLVEQRDTEEFASLNADGHFPAGTNVDEASHVPPVLTRTWFHTGVYLGREHVSDFFAGLLNDNDPGEYYREPGLTDAQAKQLLLDDTVLPDGLTVEEEREACRVLKGSMLRQEVYALDGTNKEQHPYTVTEQNFTIRPLQPMAGNRHAVFLTHPRESISYHYERNPADPRIAHALTLEVDSFGNVLKSASVGYGRRQPDSDLEPRDQTKQSQVLITYTENDVTNSVEADDDHRTPLPCETRTYELTGYTPSGAAGRFQMADFVRPASNGLAHIFDTEIKYEEKPGNGKQRRMIEHARTYYRPNDLGATQNDPLALLPFQHLESLALPGESYKLAFTPGLLPAVYGVRVTDAMLATEGRYLHNEGDANWWIPSGRVFYSPDTSDTPAQERTHALADFFLPRRHRDPFHTNLLGTETFVTYDGYDLLMQETRDALGNRITVGERNVDPTQPLVTPGHNYRVLQPALVMDPNRNRSAGAFDALGMVVGTALMGKPEDMPVPGDQLAATFHADLIQAEIDQFFTNPKGTIAATLLDTATTRVIYDLTKYWREPDPQKKLPAFAATLVRETHASDPLPPGGLKIQVSFSYSDGFGREIQKKAQAEPGPVPGRDGAGHIITVDGQPQMTANDVSPRWVGSGWTVFNNKGKPVRHYEPFFTDTHRFEFDIRIGVSPILFYDPAERVVGTLHPNHTWEKVVFDAWKQATWDVNDTVGVDDPRTDADVGEFFRRLTNADYLPTWRVQREAGGLGAEEQAAAGKAAIHANTPAIAHFDTLGRTFLTVAHNKFKRGDTPPADPPIEEFHRTRIIFDIEGNQREVIDALDRAVMRYDYDMLNNRIHQASMEAGERWMLNDVAGKPLYAWDSRDHRFRSAYDQLRRPIESYVSEAGGPELLVERTIHGESRPNPEAANLRGKVVQLFDQAGVVASDQYDFKGNLLRSQRRLAQEYKTTLDWSAAVPLEAETYAGRSRYDAINRPIQLIAPHSDQPNTKVNVIQPIYNEANLLDQVHAWLNQNAEPAGLLDPAAANLHAVTNIDYDAKGQRMLIDYGNGVRTTYAYDPLTFRLVHLLTRRDAVAFPEDCPNPAPVGWPGCQAQNLHYTYDPVGNITQIRDDAQQTIYFRNKRVEPSADYTYDAVYRLVEATGREHLGQGGAPIPHSYNDAPRVGIDWSANDGNAMGRYLERYVYDAVGNFLEMRHRGSDPANPGWTRTYAYNEASLSEFGKQNNRLTSTTVGATTETYSTGGDGYDAHGNMLRMPHLQVMQWDFKDQLQMTRRQAVNAADPDGVQHQGERTWYIYDSAGQRVRKVTELGTGQVKDERVYLSGFELYRKNGANPLVRETLHIMDDKQRIALVETRTQGTDPAPQQLIRYQFRNHLGSASLELDDQAQIISYEEYAPYGSTSYQAVRSQTETAKRYRYTGKERDEESGLEYYGARYYAPWFARWTATDPIGIGDGPNVYCFVTNNPVNHADHDGRQSERSTSEDKPASSQLTVTSEASEDWKFKFKLPGRTLGLGPFKLSNIRGRITADEFHGEAFPSIEHFSKTDIGLRADLELPGIASTALRSFLGGTVRASIVSTVSFSQKDNEAMARGEGSLHYSNTQKSLRLDADFKAAVAGPAQGYIDRGFSWSGIKNELLSNSRFSLKDVIGSVSFHDKQIVKFGLRVAKEDEGIQAKSQVLLGFGKTKLLTINASGEVLSDFSGSKGSFSAGSVIGARGTYIISRGLGYKIDAKIWGPVLLSPSMKNDSKMPDLSSPKIGAIGIGISRLQLTQKSSTYVAVGVSTISIHDKLSPYFGVRYSMRF